MRKMIVLGMLILAVGCQNSSKENFNSRKEKTEKPETVQRESPQKSDKSYESIRMSLKNANTLVQLPLACIRVEFPNKPSEILTSAEDLATPSEMHPAFYGCFDWHSCVHGYWSLVRLLKQFPELEKADSIKKALQTTISKKNIEGEVAYFKKESNKGYERTYGWAWLLKLAEEIHTWKDPLAQNLEDNLRPLTDLIVDNFKEFLPKLTKPIRIGQHENTAFGMAFAYDYARTVEDNELEKLIEDRAKYFYMNDKNCPLAYEPAGFSFLSPCLEEVDLMQRILDKKSFLSWLNDFMPQLMKANFDLKPGEVSEREDGKLVHLDGLNFSRAWVLYDLANSYKSLRHLKQLGDKHFQYSYHHIINKDSYMGSHWLGTFAIYALNQRNN